MYTIAIVNSKGGAGKTTLATNLASHYAGQGYKVAIKDYDAQGSSTYWEKRRDEALPAIQLIPMYKMVIGATASFKQQPERGTDFLIIDSPSGIDPFEYKPILDTADVIIVPVLPSSIDIHAASRFIADLLLKAKISRSKNNLAVIANRARKNTLVYRQLEKFLASLNIPFIATLRDTQHFIKASEEGIGVMDMKGEALFKDHKAMKTIIAWVNARTLEKHAVEAV